MKLALKCPNNVGITCGRPRRGPCPLGNSPGPGRALPARSMTGPIRQVHAKLERANLGEAPQRKL